MSVSSTPRSAAVKCGRCGADVGIDGATITFADGSMRVELCDRCRLVVVSWMNRVPRRVRDHGCEEARRGAAFELRSVADGLVLSRADHVELCGGDWEKYGNSMSDAVNLRAKLARIADRVSGEGCAYYESDGADDAG